MKFGEKRKRKLAERELMKRGTYLTVQSLVIAGSTNSGKNVYVVTDSRYKEVILDTVISVGAMEGKKIPQGDIKSFIEGKVTEPDCLGFVPLTQKSQDIMTNELRMETIVEGIRLAPENYHAIVLGYAS